MEKQKLRVIQDYHKLSNEIIEQIKLSYPEGYSDHLIEFPGKNGEYIIALPFETDEKIYMVRMTEKKALQLIEDDDDFDDDGILKDSTREKYEDKYHEIELDDDIIDEDIIDE